MKNPKTKKYLKQRKKEMANRKAKQSQQATTQHIIDDRKLVEKLGVGETRPESPARKAFQDL